jgi:hypothetical protein
VDTIDPGLRARNLRTLALLASLFLVPLALAFCTYYGSAWRPGRTVNHGVLISPARPLPAATLPQLTGAGAAAALPELFRGQWSLVYLGGGACADECRQALFVMRSARLALNIDMGRVAQVFLVQGACCAADLAQEYPGVLLRQFPQAGRGHTLFVVDPLGNLMMSYDARANSRGLLEDLQKLLRLSHIG